MRSIKVRLIERQRPAQFFEDCAGLRLFRPQRIQTCISLIPSVIPGEMVPCSRLPLKDEAQLILSKFQLFAVDCVLWINLGGHAAAIAHQPDLPPKRTTERLRRIVRQAREKAHS